MNTMFLICMVLCLIATAFLSVAFCKTNKGESNKNYMVRSICANITSVVVFFIVYVFNITIIEMVKVLTSADLTSQVMVAPAVMSAGLFITILFFYIAKIHLKINNFVLLAISSAFNLIVSAILILTSLNSDSSVYINLSVVVMFVFAVFSATNLLLDIKIKGQKIALTIIDLVILIAFTFAVIAIVNVGVDLYQTGMLGNIKDMIVSLSGLAIVIIAPPVCVLFSILSYILSSFEKNM